MSLTAGHWPPGDSRPRSCRGPGVKPFTFDPSGPSGRDPCATVTITGQPSIPPEGPDGSGRVAGVMLGGGSAQCAPPSPGRNHCDVHDRATLSRASRPARSRSEPGETTRAPLPVDRHQHEGSGRSPGSTPGTASMSMWRTTSNRPRTSASTAGRRACGRLTWPGPRSSRWPRTCWPASDTWPCPRVSSVTRPRNLSLIHISEPTRPY